MEVLFHFIFELIKISILGCIYATLTLLSFKFIGHFKPNTWFYRASRKKLRLWFLSGLFISIGLFFFMFTYYGEHGLGDSARVPVGHWRAIQQVNGTQAYIQDEGPVAMIEIDDFIVTDNYIYGLTGDMNENYDGDYFVYDLVENNVTTFKSKIEFTDFLKEKNLEINPDYKNFGYYYGKYWGGWRFWVLA